MNTYPKNWPEFKALVKARFNIELAIYKEKAGGVMLGDGSDYCVGPDVGYSCPGNTWGFSVNGWAFYYLPSGEWKLAKDGCFAWRRGEANPMPEISEEIGYQD